MIEKRRAFLINIFYVGILAILAVVALKFTFNNLMPFVIGFIIAFTLKPVVRKLVDVVGERKWVSILVILLFYVLVLFIITGVIFGGIALIQHYIPIAEVFVSKTVMPMTNELFSYFENLIQGLDPRMSGFVDNGISQLISALENVVEFISKSTLGWVTALVSSTPKLLISILISVISSFFFSVDYEYILGSVIGSLPERMRELVLEVKRNFTLLVGKYFKAYGILISLTFVELSIGFSVLGINKAIALAAVIALVDIMPVLGTGTVMLPWILYEVTIGNGKLGLGLFVLYVVITIIRNVLEPRIIGKQIGLHPLLTLISVFIGLKLFGFWGLFLFPIAVTIVVTMQKEKKIDIVKFFKGENEKTSIL